MDIKEFIEDVAWLSRYNVYEYYRTNYPGMTRFEVDKDIHQKCRQIGITFWNLLDLEKTKETLQQTAESLGEPVTKEILYASLLEDVEYYNVMAKEHGLSSKTVTDFENHILGELYVEDKQSI